MLISKKILKNTLAKLLPHLSGADDLMSGNDTISNTYLLSLRKVIHRINAENMPSLHSLFYIKQLPSSL